MARKFGKPEINIKDMEKIKELYKKMTTETALALFSYFGVAMSAFALCGEFFRFVPEWAAVWLFFAGVFVQAMMGMVMLVKANFFVHDFKKKGK